MENIYIFSVKQTVFDFLDSSSVHLSCLFCFDLSRIDRHSSGG